MFIDIENVGAGGGFRDRTNIPQMTRLAQRSQAAMEVTHRSLGIELSFLLLHLKAVL